MKKLTVENFLNEMTYDLRMEELERVVLKYQETLVEYFIVAQYSYKEKKRFHEVCEAVRSKKFMVTLDKLIHDSEEIHTDMAYVIMTSTDFPFVDTKIKGDAAVMAYTLREPEIEDYSGSIEMKQAITSLSSWTVRGYETTSYFRTKCAEKVIKRMPGVLFSAFGEKYSPKAFNSKILFHLFSVIIPDMKVQEIISAFFKSDFNYDYKSKYFGYATRLRSFLYELCSIVDHKVVINALRSACDSMVKFNQRHGANETFSTRYLNFKLMKDIVLDKETQNVDSKRMNDIRKAYQLIQRFAINNPEYKGLF